MRRLLSLLILAASPALAGTITISGHTYTLTNHPRVILDGPSGTITARVKDPDNAGPLVAPQATDSNPAYVALKNKVRPCRAPTEYCRNADELSVTILMLALDWYMDNSQTESRKAALFWMSNPEKWVAGKFGFGCQVFDKFCGTSSNSDWSSWDVGNAAQAYSIMRSEMTTEEREAFAGKLFNDDTSMYQDGCDNQLQQEVGATASYTSGQRVITGTNLGGLTVGRMVLIRSGTVYGWGLIESVDSATQITLTTAPYAPLGGNSGTISGGKIHELKPWTSTTCGHAWYASHHAYAPQAIMGYFTTTAFPYTVDATTISVASNTGFPTPPFNVQVPYTGELMTVTEVNGNVLTVTRSALGTTASAITFSRPLIYTKYLPAKGTNDYVMNLMIQKFYGYIIPAIACADDSASARAWLTRAADTWLTLTYPKLRDMWTGFQHAGSTSYGSGRQLTENFLIAAALKNIDPALDKTSGVWLENVVESYLYTTIPPSPSTFVPWGQSDIGATPPYHSHMWAPVYTHFFGPTANSSKYWQYWQRTVAAQYTSANLTSGSNERMIPYALMFWQESDPTADYRTALPTQKAFNVVDGDATKSLNFWVSRTGFSSSDDTLVFLNAFNLAYSTDHIGTGNAGGYKLYKRGWQLTENAPTDTGEGANTNMLRFGAAANLKTVGSLRVDLDKSDAGTGWALARVNLGKAYTSAAGATRALRYLVHFKKAASPDYLVVFDDMATSAAKALGMYLHYDKTTGSASTLTTTLPDLVWTNPARRISTKIVLPSGSGIAGTYTSLTDSHREYICASSDGSTCAAATSAEFLMVHKPAITTSDVMPPVVALGKIDADFVGVQIEGNAPSVAVFPKAGLYQSSTSFTSTHGGTAQYVVTGLEAGIYDVVRGATTIVDDATLGANGTIAFQSVAGAFAITQAGEAPVPKIRATAPPDGARK